MLTVCTGLMSDTNPARTCNVQTLKEVGVTKHLVYALKAEDSMAMCSMGCEDSELSSGGECPSGVKRSQGLAHQLNFHLVPIKSPNQYIFEVNGYSSTPMRIK